MADFSRLSLVLTENQFSGKTYFYKIASRLLLAELPQYLSKHHDALDRLYALLAIVRKVGSMFCKI